MAQDSKERRYEIPLDGKLITGDDPAKIGPNFQSLINLRYSNKHPKGVGGMTKINTSVMNATYLKARNGIHFRKSQPQESHVLTEAYNTGLTASRILQNVTAIPTAGAFSATALYTPATGASYGRWSQAPNGDVAYCNGSESCVWGGDEMEIGGFINYLNEVAAPGAGTAQAFTADAGTNILTTGALVQNSGGQVDLSTTDTLPAPLTVTTYYVHKNSDTKYTLHSSYWEGYYGANIIDITDTGAGVHTMMPFSGYPTVSTQTIYDYTEQLRNTSDDAEDSAVLHKDTDNKVYFYIGAVRPLKGFKLYVKVANTTASTMGVTYWDGNSWENVASLSDGTSSGGKSLAVTGSVTFTSTVSTAKLKYIKGIYIYWYRVILSAMNAGTSLSYATVDAPFQTIKDIWSGDNFQIDSFKVNREAGVYEATIQVRENKMDVNDGGTFMSLASLKTSEYVSCGFNERMSGCSFSFYTEASNTAVADIAVSYWNGTAWATVGTVDDGTKFSTKSFAQSGTVTWDIISPELESRRNFENGLMLYYYKFAFSGQLSADVKVFWVTGIPAQKDLSAYSFPLLSNDRLFLCCNTQHNKNTAISSSVETSSVFNGMDSTEHSFGDESDLVGGAWIYSQFGSSLFNVTLFFKRNETWALVGTGPEDWVKYRVSGVVGCVDPETIRVVDLGIENTQSLNRNVAIWRASNSIVISDGRTPIDISKDIKDMFDKRSSTYIGSIKTYSFWDSDNKEYHWIAGDRELAFSFEYQKWFEIDRTTGKHLALGIEVQDTNGANYVYGFIDTGYAERLEYGNTFDGTAIPFTMHTGDMAIHGGNVSLETTPQYSALIAVAKTVTTGTVAVSHYGDGATAANETWYITPTASGKRLVADVEHKTLGRYIFHSWKFVISTSDETVGFEPLYFYVLYDVVGDHTRDRG